MGVEDAFPRVVFHLLGVPVRDTVVVTWAILAGLAGLSYLGTRRLKDRPTGIQSVLEATADGLAKLVGELSNRPADLFLPFIGTLGVFLIVANSVSLIPGVGAPTRDLNTTAALAVIVFFSVHVYGIRLLGPRRYFTGYLQPLWILLPFNIIGELSRTLALALRLFGNVLSGEVLVAILVILAGLLVPVPLQIFGLFIGLIQAYVFTLLTMVYIAAGTRAPESGPVPEGVTP